VKVQERTYRDEYAEVLVSGDQAVVRDLSLNRYYHVAAERLPQWMIAGLAPYRARVGRSGMVFFVAAITTLLSVNTVLALGVPSSEMSAGAAPILITYTVAAVLLHEGAHLVSLQSFGRRADKVGIKMHYYVFPAFYIRMNQSLLLGRREKVIVHGAGLAANLVANIALFAANRLYFHSGGLALALQFISFALLTNAVPALNSDGYRMMLALLATNERKRLSLNPLWIRVVKMASIGFVVYYSVSMFVNLGTRYL